MNDRVKKLSAEARALPADERAELVEEIIASMVALDKSIEQAWSREADDRYAAFERGEVATVPVVDVMRRMGKR